MSVPVFEATKTVQEIAETVRSDKDRTGSDKVQILSDQDQISIKRQSILLKEYRDRSTVKRNSSGTIWQPTPPGSTTPACVSLPCQTPEKNSELSGMDQLGGAREIAKRRLSGIEGGELHRKREALFLEEK